MLYRPSGHDSDGDAFVQRVGSPAWTRRRGKFPPGHSAQPSLIGGGVGSTYTPRLPVRSRSAPSSRAASPVRSPRPSFAAPSYTAQHLARYKALGAARSRPQWSPSAAWARATRRDARCPRATMVCDKVQASSVGAGSDLSFFRTMPRSKIPRTSRSRSGLRNIHRNLPKDKDVQLDLVKPSPGSAATRKVRIIFKNDIPVHVRCQWGLRQRVGDVQLRVPGF